MKKPPPRKGKKTFIVFSVEYSRKDSKRLKEYLLEKMIEARIHDRPTPAGHDSRAVLTLSKKISQDEKEKLASALKRLHLNVTGQRLLGLSAPPKETT